MFLNHGISIIRLKLFVSWYPFDYAVHIFSLIGKECCS